MPQFLTIFIDLFIVLASILGIVIAIQGREFLAIQTFRIRVMAMFIVSFTMCTIAASTFLLSHAGLEETTIWKIVSGVAIIANLAFAPLMIKTRRLAVVNKELNTLTIDAGLGIIALFPLWFIANISGYFGPPSGTPLGTWFLAIFVVSSFSFVRIALYQPPDETSHQYTASASTQEE